jgi:hypothetical protein
VTDGELPRIPTGLFDGGAFVWANDHALAVRELRDQHQSQVEQLVGENS